MFSRMPAARKPDRTFATVFPACQMAMRIGDSFMLYQPEVTDPCELESKLLSRIEASLTESQARKERSFCQSDEEASHAKPSTAYKGKFRL